MAIPAPTQVHSQWLTAPKAWDEFVDQHPELGFKHGRWAFHNFLRHHRQQLIEADAIRLARNRFWIAHRERLPDAAFACATGSTHGPGKASAAREGGD